MFLGAHFSKHIRRSEGHRVKSLIQCEKGHPQPIRLCLVCTPGIFDGKQEQQHMRAGRLSAAEVLRLAMYKRGLRVRKQ